MRDLALRRELMRIDRIAHKLLGDLLTHFRDRVPLWVLEHRVIACSNSQAPSSADLMTNGEVRAWFTGRAADLRSQIESLSLVASYEAEDLRLVEEIWVVVRGIEKRWQVGFLGVLWETLVEDAPRNAWWSGYGDENSLMDDIVTITDGVATMNPQHDGDDEEYAGKGLWTGEFEEGDTLLEYRRELYGESVCQSYVLLKR